MDNKVSPKWFIYGYSFIVDQLQCEDLSHLFSLTKNFINMYRKQVSCEIRNNLRVNCHFIKEEICKFMFSIKEDCFHLILNGQGHLIFTEIQNLLLFIGRLSSQNDSFIGEILSSRNENCQSNQYFYLLTNLWMTSLEILFIINEKLGLDTLSLVSNYIGDFRTQLVEIIISDAIFIALQVLIGSIENILHICLDDYKFLEKLLAFIKRLVQKDDVLIDIHPFWFHCNKIIESFDTFRKSFDIKFEHDVDLIKLWLLSYLMQVFNDDVSKESLQIVNCNPLATQIILALLKKEVTKNHNSQLVITTLHLCLKITKCCSPCADLMLPFIDYFMRCFYSENSTSKIIPKSSLHWQKKLEMRLKGSLVDCEDLGLNLFMLLLDQTLSKLVSCKERQSLVMLQKIKGRFYSKLQPKRIEDLDCTNLFNLSSVLILLCFSCKEYWNDVGEKLCDVVRIVTKKNLICEKTSLMIKALFTTMSLLHDRGNLDHLVETSVSIFNKLVENLSFDLDILSTKRNLLTDLIFMYLDEVKNLIDSKSFAGSNKLISQHIIVLFNKLVDREKMALLKFIDSYLLVIRNSVFHLFIDDALRYFLPYCKSQFIIKQPQFDVSNISASLVVLSLFKESKPSNNEFRNLVLYFAGNPRVDITNILKFSEKVFNEKDSLVQKEVESLFPDFIERIFRCDEIGQAKLKQVLQLLIEKISERKNNIEIEFLLPSIEGFVRKYLGQELPSKIIKVLEICVSIAPLIKNRVVSTVLQVIDEVENKRKQGPDDEGTINKMITVHQNLRLKM